VFFCTVPKSLPSANHASRYSKEHPTGLTHCIGSVRKISHQFSVCKNLTTEIRALNNIIPQHHYPTIMKIYESRKKLQVQDLYAKSRKNIPALELKKTCQK